MADARNRKNVLVGAPNVQASGGALIGDVVEDTAQFPTDATGAIAGLGQKPAGFIGEEGLTKTVNRTTEKIRDWNRDTVIVLETEHDVTLKFKFLESANGTVLKTIYGDENVTIGEDGKIMVADAAGALPHKNYTFEMNGGDGKAARAFIPDGQVTNVGDITYAKNGVISYDVEVECFADKNGKKFYFFADTTAAVDEVAGG